MTKQAQRFGLFVALMAFVALGCDDDTANNPDQFGDVPDGSDVPVNGPYLQLENPAPGEALRIFYNSDSNVQVRFLSESNQAINGANLSFEIVSSTDYGVGNLRFLGLDFIVATSHETLDRIDRVGGIRHLLMSSRLADQTVALVGECHDRWRGPVSG